MITDTLLYTILYLNLNIPEKKFFVKRDIKLNPKSKISSKVNNKNNFIDTYMTVVESNVFFVKS